MGLLNLCEVLAAFHRTDTSDVMPCASFDLRLAVNKARMQGLLHHQDGGLILSAEGAKQLADCRTARSAARASAAAKESTKKMLSKKKRKVKK